MSQNKLWLLKHTNGRVQGPLSTNDIIHLIKDKAVHGEESISVYPDGRWKPISVEPLFYEPLLSALSEEDKTTAEGSVSTGGGDSGESSVPSATVIADKSRPKSLNRKRKRSLATRRPSQKKISKEKTVIYYEDEEPEELEEKALHHQKTGLSFLFRRKTLIGLFGFLILLFFFWPDGTKSPTKDYVELKKPATNRPALPQDQVDLLIKKSWQKYLQGKVPSYIKAQALLIRAVEGDPKNTYAMAMLCLVYLELWPWTRQDTSSFNTLSYITHKTSEINKGGVRSGLCHSMDLIIKGKYEGAKTMAESSLDGLGGAVEDRESQKMIPFFYYLKARALYYLGDYTAVISYLDTLQKMIPPWRQPYILSAEVFMKEGKVAEALSMYRKVLKLDPQHKLARIKTALIEYQHFNKTEKAKTALISALTYQERIHPQVMSEAWFALAEINLKKGQTTQALKYARKAYSYNPADKASQNLIIQISGGKEKLDQIRINTSQLIYEGDQLVLKNKFQSAIGYYEEAFSAEKGKNAMVAVKIAKAYWALSFSDQAILWLKKAINANPQLMSAYTLMAEYYAELYDFPNAEKILKIAFRKKVRSYELYRGRAHLALKQGRYSKAIQYAKTALSIYSADLESYVIISQAYAKSGDTNEALAFATRALEVDPNAIKTQTNYARALGGAYGWSSGIAYFQKMVENYPLITEYRVEKMKYLFEEEQYKMAKEEVQKIIGIDPKSNTAWFYLGRVIMYERDFKSAYTAFLQSAILNPSDPKPTFYIGQLRLKEKNYKEARRHFQKVLALNPLYPKAHYYLGRVAFLEKEYETAIEEARLESRSNPRLVLPYLLAGESYEKSGQFLNCSVEYQKAVQLAPENMSFYVKVARCYRKSGHLDLARKILKKASGEGSVSKVKSGDPHLYKELGIINEMKGDYQSASNSYCTYLNLIPLAPDRPDIEGRLKKLARLTGEKIKRCG